MGIGGGRHGGDGESAPRVVEGEELAIAVKVRLAPKDRRWHDVPAPAGSVEGYDPADVEATIAQLLTSRAR